MRATTLLYTSLQLEVCTQNYGPSKSWKSQFREFWDFHLGVPGQNDIWVLVPWPSTKCIIKGKVLASPNLGRDEFCEFVFVCSSSMHQKCSDYELINLLFGLCISVWIIEPLVAIPILISKLEHAPIPSKCYELENAINSYFFRCFHLWTHSWVNQGTWGCITHIDLHFHWTIEIQMYQFS
jgi:hypothetical protein